MYRDHKNARSHFFYYSSNFRKHLLFIKIISFHVCFNLMVSFLQFCGNQLTRIYPVETKWCWIPRWWQTFLMGGVSKLIALDASLQLQIFLRHHEGRIFLQVNSYVNVLTCEPEAVYAVCCFTRSGRSSKLQKGRQVLVLGSAERGTTCFCRRK